MPRIESIRLPGAAPSGFEGAEFKADGRRRPPQQLYIGLFEKLS
jgi:hypothetical protein